MSRIGHSKGATILGEDDELLRCTSKKLERPPWKIVHNPKKGIGIHGTSMGSALTGMILALHFSRRDEKPEDTLNALSILLFGEFVTKNNEGKANGCVACQDRERANAGVISRALRLGSWVVGTQRRSEGFPITFGRTVSSAITLHRMSSSAIREYF